MHYLHNAPEASDDTRYVYHWRVLKAVLEATRKEYGDYRLEPAPTMNESRQIREMSQGSSRINTLVLDPTWQMEDNLQPVRVPIDKGLLGYRLFLIHANQQARFSTVRTLADLRAFRIGQGCDWSDLKVYVISDIPTTCGSNYNGLFAMLMAGRFDAFPRGVSEIVPEYQRERMNFADMRIEQSLLIYYPMPMYFWFQKNPAGDLLAKRVALGMQRLIEQGSLDRLFAEEFAPTIQQLKLDQRRMLRLENPNLSPAQPYDDKRLWYHPQDVLPTTSAHDAQGAALPH